MDRNRTVETAVIVGAGEFTDRGLPAEKQEDVLLIAADGGLTHLENAGLAPDVVIGDFDSLGYTPEEAGDTSGKEHPEVITLPVEKDDTDMEAAIRFAWDHGCRAFELYGASGDRPDHFLANLQLLARISRLGGDARLIAPGYTVYALTNDRLVLKGKAGTTFSVFTMEKEAGGVNISGSVQYPLKNALLTNDRSLGVSNQMTGPEAVVEVADGTLLIFQYGS